MFHFRITFDASYGAFVFSFLIFFFFFFKQMTAHAFACGLLGAGTCIRDSARFFLTLFLPRSLTRAREEERQKKPRARARASVVGLSTRSRHGGEAAPKDYTPLQKMLWQPSETRVEVRVDRPRVLEAARSRARARARGGGDGSASALSHHGERPQRRALSHEWGGIADTFRK